MGLCPAGGPPSLLIFGSLAEGKLCNVAGSHHDELPPLPPEAHGNGSLESWLKPPKL